MADRASSAERRGASRLPRQATVRAANRSATIDAARELFAERGYGATNLATIAQHAGVSSATVYKHFPTKAQVLAAVVRREWFVGTPDLSAIMAEGGCSGIADGLTRIGTAFVRFLRTPGTTELFRLIIAEVPNVPELAQVGSFVDGPYYVLTRSFLDAELGAEVDDRRRESAARRFVGIIAGQVLWPALLDPQGTPPRTDDDGVVGAAIAATLRDLNIA